MSFDSNCWQSVHIHAYEERMGTLKWKQLVEISVADGRSTFRTEINQTQVNPRGVLPTRTYRKHRSRRRRRHSSSSTSSPHSPGPQRHSRVRVYVCVCLCVRTPTWREQLETTIAETPPMLRQPRRSWQLVRHTRLRCVFDYMSKTRVPRINHV